MGYAIPPSHLQQHPRRQQLHIHAAPKVNQLQAQRQPRVLIACMATSALRQSQVERARKWEKHTARRDSGAPAPLSQALQQLLRKLLTKHSRPGMGAASTAPSSPCMLSERSVTSRLSGLMSVCTMRAAGPFHRRGQPCVHVCARV